MSTVRQDIRDAFITAINTARPVGVPEATRRRFIPGQRVSSQRLGVFFVKEENVQPGGRSGAVTKRALTLATQVVDAVEDPEDADDSVEPSLTWLVSVLAGSNLGGLVFDIQETATVWETQNHDLFYVAATVTWTVTYQTQRANLAAKQ
jgi:hypothetical protein